MNLTVRAIVPVRKRGRHEAHSPILGSLFTLHLPSLSFCRLAARLVDLIIRLASDRIRSALR